MSTLENFRKFTKGLEQNWNKLNSALTEYSEAQDSLARGFRVIGSIHARLGDSENMPVHKRAEVEKLAKEYWLCQKNVDVALQAYNDTWEKTKKEVESFLKELGEEKY